MKILYIVTAFPRWPGDVITPWLTETIDRLRDRGVDVEVLAPSFRGQPDHVASGTKVHRFRYAPALFETLTHEQTAPDRIRERPWYLSLVPGYVLAGSLAAVRLTRREKFDCVHAFWPIPHGLLGLATREFAGTPLISTFFGVELTWLRNQLPFLAPLARRIIRRSDAVTVISSYTEKEVSRLAPTVDVRVIPFGAAFGAATENGESPPTTANGVFRLLFVGRLVERKGLSILLRAIARLPDRNAVRLVIAGEGPLRQSLEAEATGLGVADRVEFAGLLSTEEIVQRFRDCDAFVLPAVRDSKGDVEGLGVVLLEAMTHGRPVIASNSGGIPDIVVHEKTGLLTQPGDAEDLSTAIERLRTDAELRAQLVRGARAHIAANFNWDRIIDELVNLYGEVAARGEAAGRTATGGER